MIDLKMFEHQQIRDLLALFDTIFYQHPVAEEVKDILNVLNLSMRRIISILEEDNTTEEVDQQIGELNTVLHAYVETLDGVRDEDNQIPKFIDDFLDLVQTYYKFVDKDREAVTDMCNVFRIVTEIYMLCDRNDVSRKAEIVAGLNELVDDWLSGKVKPPSSSEEIPEDAFNANPDDDLSDLENPQYETVIVEFHNQIAYVKLHRPEKRNAMNLKMIEELDQVLQNLEDNDIVRLLIITGNQEVFCAGADLSEMQAAQKSSETARELSLKLGSMLHRLRAFPKPVITLAYGSVMGGGIGLMCASDIALVSDEVTFSFPGVHLGFVPSLIAPFVVERIGLTHARRFMLTGERFDAFKALKMGLVTEVSVPDRLNTVCERYIKQLLSGGAQALAACKEMIRKLATQDADTSLQYASDVFVETLTGDEAKEGIQAFLQKQKPSWHR